MNGFLPLFSFAALGFFSSVCAQPSSRDFESELIQYLKNNITNYSPLMRPLLNGNRPVYITMDAAISQLVSVDTAKQSAKIAAFVQAYWTEERLVWDPRDFGGIGVVNWDSSQIWFPVIMIYNGIGAKQILTAQVPVYLTSMSTNQTMVTAIWRREFEFSCWLDTSRFPQDQHECKIELFYSDQGHQNKLVLPVKNDRFPVLKIDGLYRANSEWRVTNMSTRVEMVQKDLLKGYPAVLGPIRLPMFVIRIEMSRVAVYYFMIVIAPLLMLTLLQVLVFFVPEESQEKLGLGITIMLSYTVFLLLLDGILPKTQTASAVALFITAAMILSTISLLLTSLIMRFNSTPEATRMPIAARVFFIRFLGHLFCVRGANQKDGSTETGTPVGSDWVMAAHALERLMVAMGMVAIVAIVAVFVIKPYA